MNIDDAYKAWHSILREQKEIVRMIMQQESSAKVLDRTLDLLKTYLKTSTGAAIHVADPGNPNQLVLAASTLPAAFLPAITYMGVGGEHPIGQAAAAFMPSESYVHSGTSLPKGLDFESVLTYPLLDSNSGFLGVLSIFHKPGELPEEPELLTIEIVQQTIILSLEQRLPQGDHVTAEETERQTRDQITKERLDLYKVMMDAPAMIAVLRAPEHIFELANTKYVKAVNGKRDRPLLGKPVREALPELVGQGIIDILDEVFTTGIAYHGNQVLIQLDRDGTGELQGAYFNFTYHPIHDPRGEVQGIFVHAVDVTEIVNARKKIEESEELLRAVIDSSLYPTAVYRGREMRIVLTNQALLDTWDKKEPVIGKTFREALPELEGQPFFELLDKVYSTGQPYRAKEDKVELMYHGAMRTFYFDFIYQPLYDREGRIFGVLNTATDVTELVTSKQRLEAVQEQLQLSMKSGRLGVWDYTVETGEITCDERACELFGFPGDAANTTLDDMLKYIYPDDVPRVVHGIKLALQPGSDGNYDIQYRTIGGDGVHRWIQSQGKAYFNEHNEPVRFSGIAFDITAQKLLEKQKDNFLGIASHELKTPVTSLKAYAQLLEAMFRKQGDQKAATMLSRMDQQLNKLTSLIGDLLDVTKFQSGKLQYNDSWFDFNTLGDEIVEELQRITVKHTIEKKFGEPVRVFADRERIGQVLSNLLNNAIKYSPDADRILVTSCVDNGSLKVCVQDFGVGLAQNDREKVFEQFYRVSGDIEHTFPGLGLGLYISSEIIKREGGRIWVEKSAPGEGATFCFMLPIAEDQKDDKA